MNRLRYRLQVQPEAAPAPPALPAHADEDMTVVIPHVRVNPQIPHVAENPQIPHIHREPADRSDTTDPPAHRRIALKFAGSLLKLSIARRWPEGDPFVVVGSDGKMSKTRGWSLYEE